MNSGEHPVRELPEAVRKGAIQLGDWVYITNPYFKQGDPFRGENVTLLPKGKLFAPGLGPPDAPMGIIDADVYTAQIRRAAEKRGINLTLDQVGSRSVFGVRSRPTGWGR